MSEGPAVRVVMVSPGFHPYVGGAEKQALELSKRLRSLGAQVSVVTRRLPGLAGFEEIQGIPVRRVFCAGGGFLNALTFLCSVFLHLVSAGRAYDVIHVHLAGSPALAACLAGRLLGARVVVKVGGGRGIGEIATSARTAAGGLKLALLRFFSPVFVAVTEDLREEMLEMGMTGDIWVVPNGVDTKRYRPADAAGKKALRADLGWGGGRCFLYVGRFAAEKRLAELLEEFAAAVNDPRARLILVGAGPEEARLRERAGETGLAGRVLFLPPTEDVEKYYAAADVFVLPSISEGLSNALLEAMAGGLAVLASRVGGTQEAVRDGESGLLFDPEDGAALREGLRRFVSEEGLAGRLGAAARRDAESRYGLEKVAERYLEIYH